MKNKVVCKICDNKYKSITAKHLQNKHNITVKEYKMMIQMN